MQKGHWILIGILLSGCHQEIPIQKPVAVHSYTVHEEAVPMPLSFVGVAKSSHPVEVRSRVEGYLWGIHYTEGGYVEKGALLFTIDPRSFEAKVEEAKAVVARQEAVLWNAKASYERIEPLYRVHAASKRDLDDATASVLTAEAELIQAEANLVDANLNLSYTKIEAPIAGWMGKALYREGTLISPSINGFLAELVVIDPIWVYFPLTDERWLAAKKEQEAHRLELPAPEEYTVHLVLSDGSEFPAIGHLNFASPYLDPATGTLTVRAQFDNKEGTILPGQFVKARVEGAVWPRALLVPQTAVFSGEKGFYVWVIGSDQRVAQRWVEVGDWVGDQWMIQGGLQPGEKIVSEGVNRLYAGVEVQVQP